MVKQRSTRVGAIDGRRPIRRGEEGYNLVMLIIGITILNIMVAIALPLMSYTIRRDREEETIFRGLQYAEAIRVFRQRFGRYPATLEELVKVEPRSIRQLWNEPLSEDGEFGLVVEAPQQAPGTPQTPGQPAAAPTPVGQPVTLPPGVAGGSQFGGFGVGGNGKGAVNLLKLPRSKGDEDEKKSKTLTSGPIAIHGVYLDREGESLRKFLGQDKYEQWVFTAELITPPVTAPGRPLPRVRDDWIGKSFPDGLSPSMGGGPTGPDGAPIPAGTGPDGKPLDPKAGGKPGEKPGEDKEGEDTGEPPPDLDEDAPTEFPEDFPQEQPSATIRELPPPEGSEPVEPPPVYEPPDDDGEPPVEEEPPPPDDSGEDTGADDLGADENPE